MIDNSNTDFIAFGIEELNESDFIEFLELFENSFNEDERDSTDEIIERFINKKHPHTILGFTKNNSKIVSGAILEYYEHSKIILIAYHFKDKSLDKFSYNSLFELIEKTLLNDKNVNPDLILFEGNFKENLHNNDLVSYFDLLDNKTCIYIDKNYIEPVSKKDDLKLGGFALKEPIKEVLNNSKFENFLKELYEPYKYKFLVNNTNEPLNEKFRQIPKFVFPRLKLKNVSISLHYVHEIEHFKELHSSLQSTIKNVRAKKERFCKVFNSFENDLFSQNYVEKPPYFSKNIGVIEANLTFNEKLLFNSEGRNENFTLINRSKNILEAEQLTKAVKIYLNYTYFEIEKILVWEVVIRPKTYFNEFEVIQLTKLYTGKQESSESDKPELLVSGKKTLNVFIKELIENKIKDDLLKNQSIKIPKINFTEPEAGTAQIDLKNAEYCFLNDDLVSVEMKSSRKKEDYLNNEDWYFSDIFQYYNSDNKKDDLGFDKLNEIYQKFSDARYVLNTFCGIALGIFDFERMSFEEVSDTISPLTTTDSYFLQLNKNAINCFSINNNILETSIEQGIGINPYLIIPNSVLAYNSFITSRVIKLNESNSLNTIANFEHKIDNINNYLDNIIPNVFQYETEIDLYNEGMDRRGIIEKKEEIKTNKNKFENDLEALNNKRNYYLTSVALALSIISLTQVHEFVKGLFNDKIETLAYFGICLEQEYIKKIALYTPISITILVSMLFGVLFFLTPKRKKRRFFSP